MQIIWLGHSGFRIEIEEAVLLVDPWLTGNPMFPAEARAAFERGAVDAWVIWDPFLAAVEKQTGARILADGRGVVNNYNYYLAERGFVEKHPQVIQALFDELLTQSRWLKANVKQAAAQIAPLMDAGVTPMAKVMAPTYRDQMRWYPAEAAIWLDGVEIEVSEEEKETAS